MTINYQQPYGFYGPTPFQQQPFIEQSYIENILRLNLGKTISVYMNFENFDNNTIIYGHNLINRTMFGSIPYMLNKNWFKKEIISCPNVNDDTSYELNTNNHKITMINHIDVNKVYLDLFKKLGE